jgi:type III secretory pathway component EscT
MPEGDALLTAIARELNLQLARSGIDPEAWLLGWARLMPSLLLIPAFGLRILPLLARALFALILAATVAPSLGAASSGAWIDIQRPWWVTLGAELLAGLPLGASAAVTIWAATMAGNLIDRAQGRKMAPSNVEGVDSAASAIGVLLSLGAAAAFLTVGGPARLADALSAAEPLSRRGSLQTALDLCQGIQVAVLIAAPLVLLAALLEVFHGLLGRVGSPVLASSVVPALRSLVLLIVFALLLDRVLAGLVSWMDVRLPPA